MIHPNDQWIRLTEPDQLLAFSKQLKLTPKTFSELKPLIYSGAYTNTPVPCTLAGYIDESYVVIQFAEQLHTIHVEYLRDMQKNLESKAPETPAVNVSEPAVSAGTEKQTSYIYTVLDIETTGLNREEDEIIEIAALRVKDGAVIDTFSQLVQPSQLVSLDVTMLTGITNDMLDHCPDISKVLPLFLEFIGDTPLVGHNISGFDLPILNRVCTENNQKTISNHYFDTLNLSRSKLNLPNYKLQTVAKALKVLPGQAHRALGDCETTLACYEKLRSNRKARPKISAEQLNRFKSRPKAKEIHPTVTKFDPSHPLYDQTCVFTGELKKLSDREAMQGVADHGGHCADNVTKKTTLLITGGNADPAKKSGKMQKAEQYISKGLAIRIITEEEFLTILHK